jgi:hypothetical protein
LIVIAEGRQCEFFDFESIAAFFIGATEQLAEDARI